jgi:hypothetical protein
MLIIAHICTALALMAFAIAIYFYYRRTDHGGKITEMLGVIGFVLLLTSAVIRLSLSPIP